MKPFNQYLNFVESGLVRYVIITKTNIEGMTLAKNTGKKAHMVTNL